MVVNVSLFALIGDLARERERAIDHDLGFVRTRLRALIIMLERERKISVGYCYFAVCDFQV